MEKAMTKVGSLWISKKAKQEFSTITHDLSYHVVKNLWILNFNVKTTTWIPKRKTLLMKYSLSGTVEEKARWVLNKLKGKPLKSLPELLREYSLPTGLFPQNIKCYEFDEARGKLIVYFASACEVCFKDSSIVRYACRVKCTVTKGKMSGIEGMKTKVLVWVKVTSISVESYKSDKICFNAGVKISRPRDAYDMPRDAIRVEEF